MEKNLKIKDILNQKNKIDGLQLLKMIDDDTVKACFFDPQYRGILDKMQYGNEGKSKEKRRVALPQMEESLIISFINEIGRTLVSSGHLFLWVDKFHLCQGLDDWFKNTDFQKVDLVVWEKPKIGMGYRTRNKCEFLLVLQKKPIRVKGIWTKHNIPNVWKEGVETKDHPHSKPLKLQTALMEAISSPGDLILDPAMGSGSVLDAAKSINRKFIGGDIE